MALRAVCFIWPKMYIEQRCIIWTESIVKTVNLAKVTLRPCIFVYIVLQISENIFENTIRIILEFISNHSLQFSLMGFTRKCYKCVFLNLHFYNVLLIILLYWKQLSCRSKTHSEITLHCFKATDNTFTPAIIAGVWYTVRSANCAC